ncbi:MAG: hypothetical protein L0229_15890 [Blastocatellia bacterium]|nr:hypothetical protein [Blastocatellia bacterium]
MSVNKNLPHVFVLPEDAANRQLAEGFRLEVDSTRYRQMDVLEVARGWHQVLHLFKSDHVAEMYRYSQRFMVLLIDFDGQQDRLNTAKATIPDDLTDRVFILGVWKEPEDLKRAKLGSYETIGSRLAQDCRDDEYTTWEHDLLRHNKDELDRLREHVRPILFQTA